MGTIPVNYDSTSSSCNSVLTFPIECAVAGVLCARCYPMIDPLRRSHKKTLAEWFCAGAQELVVFESQRLPVSVPTGSMMQTPYSYSKPWNHLPD